MKVVVGNFSIGAGYESALKNILLKRDLIMGKDFEPKVFLAAVDTRLKSEVTAILELAANGTLEEVPFGIDFLNPATIKDAICRFQPSDIVELGGYEVEKKIADDYFETGNTLKRARWESAESRLNLAFPTVLEYLDLLPKAEWYKESCELIELYYGDVWGLNPTTSDKSNSEIELEITNEQTVEETTASSESVEETQEAENIEINQSDLTENSETENQQETESD